jgi:hypothetical protein
MTRFKQAADSHPCLRNLIEQYYVFDPMHDNGSLVGTMAANFQSWVNARSNRRVRFYNNATSGNHRTFLGRALPATPFVEDSSPNGPRTVGVIPDVDMQAARSGAPGDGFDYHNDFAAVYLTDAMRKSGFR